MIGPAELEEMAAELAEAKAQWLAADLAWPSFVDDLHIDGADRILIGSYANWIDAMARTSTAS